MAWGYDYEYCDSTHICGFGTASVMNLDTSAWLCMCIFWTYYIKHIYQSIFKNKFACMRIMDSKMVMKMKTMYKFSDKNALHS